MAITKSAKKAQRVAERRRVFNIRRSRTMKDLVKEATQLITAKKASEATTLLPQVFQAVDKAVQGGVLKLNAGARVKARLTKRIRAIA